MNKSTYFENATLGVHIRNAKQDNCSAIMVIWSDTHAETTVYQQLSRFYLTLVSYP